MTNVLARLKLIVITGLLTACLDLFVGSSLVIAEEGLSAAWQARAFSAADRMAKIRARLEGSKDRWDSPEAYRARCEAMLEAAFAMHVLEEPVVHKIVGGVHAFKILLLADGSRYFDLTYIYAPNNKTVDAVKIVALPPDWELIVLGRGLLLQIPTSDSSHAAPREMCAIAFSLDDPFFAQVMLR